MGIDFIKPNKQDLKAASKTDKDDLYTKNCIRTHSGVYMNIEDPKLYMIRIEDIAHALSHQCRFAGHLPEFYSVAQHCVMSTHLVDDDFKLEALLHDASEAYLLDIPKPIKPLLNNYKAIEGILMLLIGEKYGFTYPLSTQVKEADEIMLEWEWSHLMLKDKTLPHISCWSPNVAKSAFLSKFDEYSKGLYPSLSNSINL